MRWFVVALFGVASIAVACGGAEAGPEQSLNRFVDSINDADFNDAYAELTSRCQFGTSLDEFQMTYGQSLLAFGIGSGFLGGELKAEDVNVTSTGDYTAEITLDWVLHSSVDNPFPLSGNLFEGKLPLNTVVDVAGTADNPLNVFDETRKGDWRLDDCDPLGLEGADLPVGF